ncbi:MAG: hypothetical protein M3N95_15815 [Actinomycetota bacterium]|nr:hypothetical protein [Actinomycetota bacterium]
MSDLLIRDVPADDLEQIRAAAAARGTSVQSYLRDAVHAQAVYVRRQAALGHIAGLLKGRPGVPEEERSAVLAAIQLAHDERADDTGGPQRR